MSEVRAAHVWVRRRLVDTESVFIRGTGSRFDGRVMPSNHLPLGVRPDRFGRIAWRQTGEYLSVDGRLVEIVEPA